MGAAPPAGRTRSTEAERGGGREGGEGHSGRRENPGWPSTRVAGGEGGREVRGAERST